MSELVNGSFTETPDTVHGRLLEAFHITGYSVERACLSLEWLLDEDRWKQVGSGFAEINEFLATLNLAHLKIAKDRRKKLAMRLDDMQASQRATARALGVSHTTLQRDLGNGTNVPDEENKFIYGNDLENDNGTSVPVNIDARSRMHEQVQKRDDKQRTTGKEELTIEKKYKVIYADPPWDYGLNNRTGWGGDASTHYTTMSIQELCDLPVLDLAEENAVLFIWVTSPFLEKSFSVINAWGFTYKASFVWDKIKHNMGHYNSVRHEFLLVCTKGSATPENKKLFDSVQSIERSNKHSEKPKEFRDIINTLYPSAGKIELFSRTISDGWDMWGNDS